jgi:hypothetical protein
MEILAQAGMRRIITYSYEVLKGDLQLPWGGSQSLMGHNWAASL